MNKDEMIKDIRAIIDDRCEAELGQVHAESKGGKVTKTVSTSLIAKDIYNAKYRKVGEDEIVIKKSEYEELNKDFYDWKKEYDHNCLLRLEVFELEKQLEQAKQETREILQELKDLFGTSREFNWSHKGTVWEGGSIGNPISDKIKQFAKDKGIELEDNDEQRRN